MESNEGKVKLSDNRSRLLKVWVFWLLFLILFLPTQIAGACSPAINGVNPECDVDSKFLSGGKVCVDDECLVWVDRNERNEYSIYRGELTVGEIRLNDAKKAFHPFFEAYSKDELLDFSDLTKLCAEVFSSDMSEVEDLFNSFDPSKHYFLEIKPYSREVETRLEAIQTRLYSCEDVNSAVSGNWMASYELTKSYCKEYPEFITYCPFGVDRIVPLLFVEYLILHPGPLTYPSIAILTFFSLVLIGSNLYFLEKGELLLFYRFSRIHMLGFAFGFLFFVYIFLLYIPYLAISFFGYYYLLSLINYLTKRAQHSEPV